MPAPLTPPDCDLQDFPFMPLHVARLRDSDLASEESPEACWYAVLLWAASWHQIPAASLPDNDAVLARLVGLGRDLRTWKKHKSGALRGFVLCDDGRLYHPVVADQAAEAWDRKRQQRWRTECARIKKANQRDGGDRPTPTYDEWLSQAQTGPSPDFVPEDKEDCPPGHPVQETGTGTETETSKITPQPPRGGVSDDEFDAIWSVYPESGRETCPALQARDEIDAAVAEGHGVAVLLAGAKRVAAHVAAGGRAKRIDRWARDRLFLNTAPPKGPTVCGEAWTGPPDLFADAAAAKGAAWADAYLRRCAWRDGALVTDSKTVRRVVQAEIEQILAAHGARIELGAEAA